MSNEKKTISDFEFNLICEYFSGTERQGPGSSKMTLKALSFIDNLTNKSRIADLGCGTGSQTIVLAQNTAGTITGVDLFPDFINQFNQNAQKLNLQSRVKGIAGNMADLPFTDEKFDLIWSEGAVANIGFEKALNYWKNYLEKDGYIAVTYESWFTKERPAEVEQWWLNAVPEINTIGYNISIMQKAGFIPAATFILPENCWIDNYFTPQKARQEEFLKKYAGKKTVEDMVSLMKYEADLYSRYKQYYGYVFYIGKKI